MASRQIVQIDEEKCDGCGQCVSACAEARSVSSTARRNSFPTPIATGWVRVWAIVPAARSRLSSAKPIRSTRRPSENARTRRATATHQQKALRAARARRCGNCRSPRSRAQAPTLPQPGPTSHGPTLCHWPIQLHLVPPNAPFLHQADLFLVADCVPFACADFHQRILQGRPVVIGCPKLDDGEAYVDKLAEMLAHAELKSLTVVHMEVPCCTKLMRIATEAVRRANVEVPLHDVTIAVPVPFRASATGTKSLPVPFSNKPHETLRDSCSFCEGRPATISWKTY